MDAVGAVSYVLIGVAALAALGGYIAGVVRQRNKRRVRGYFALGVVTGFMAAVITRRRLDRLVPVARRLALPQRFDNPLTLATLQLRRGLNSVLTR
ncbi:hypothetical protein FHT40_005639 [Mycolicibacterium sp. BK556]|uniref:hypothetical protein n=1 Tax=Mycobacteriaceae TaxID=1762 RepID=UPI00105EF6DF|nr:MULTISPECIES: hypothetical protein [Mycobacteriaceae]MBB3605950.1 hypothetical protein [Mycolicibacterium sp. BK556]MBB3632527.1 hypothetical protein [Mycolicibacterium sp. BK607]MBB3753923.1 hypothetical protein [Mycolicibacterium sp. BK634]TDO18100.1 hypothetical protein EV580_1281 [Mycobacterium sp. BK086]